MHPVQLATLAPIGNRIHGHVEQLRRCLRTIAAIAALSRRAGSRPHGTRTLDPIGIAQPVDLTGGKRTALATQVAFIVKTRGNIDIREVLSELPDPLECLGRRSANDISRFGTFDLQRTARMSLPADVDPNSLFSLGQHHVFDQEAQDLFALGVGGGLRLPDGWQIVHQVEDALALRFTDMV